MMGLSNNTKSLNNIRRCSRVFWKFLSSSIHHLVRWFPVAYAVVCIVVFCLAVKTFFSSEPKKKDHLGRSDHSTTCGTVPSYSSINKMALSVRLSKLEKNEATIYPELHIKSKDTKRAGKAKPLYDVVLASIANGGTIFPSYKNFNMKSNDDQDEEYRVLTGEPTTIPIYGTPKLFPFDEYLIAISAGNVEEVNSNELIKPNPFSVTVDLPIEYSVRVLNDREEFKKRNTGPLFWRERESIGDECCFIVQRPTWFKLGVLELMLLLVAPILYVLYGDKESPGLELITTMVYIGYIRSYLLHPGNDIEFYAIDFVFAIVIVAVAVIPTIKLSIRSSRDTEHS